MIKQTLDGIWQLCCAEDKTESYPAAVPGDVHRVLWDAGVIDDPYYGKNCEKCGWVAQKDWIYSTVFSISEKHEKMLLVLDGIDTFAQVFLNGKKLADTDNMFLQYRLDISGAAVIGENRLEIHIKSVYKELEKHPKDRYFACFNPQRIFLRKAQFHFSWDWAPKFPGVGICGSVRLEMYDTAAIRCVNVQTDLDGTVKFFIELFSDCDFKLQKDFVLTLCGKEYKFSFAGTKGYYCVKLDNPQLWWPRSLGASPMYRYSLTLAAGGAVRDTYSGRFGIRTVKLIEKPRADVGGMTFRLEVNNVPVFLKGANFVPMDIMTGCIDDAKYRRIFDLMANAGFTMLRIWGGGIYEKDIFYDLCDDYGILVWQDFMFACGDIPDDNDAFCENVMREVQYQVERLRNHPSIALWCGGNEKSGENGVQMDFGYKLVNFYLRGICAHLDPTRPYIRTSPHGYTDIANSPDSGDTHLNCINESMPTPENPDAPGVKHFRDVLKNFTSPMETEIAVQGAPTAASLKKYIPADKLWPLNDVYDYHFMSNPYDGTGLTYAEQQLAHAEALLGKVTGFYDFCKKSSLLHCELVRAECEHAKARLGSCGGSMLWMVNDTWPCGTWSVIDYYLTPMPAYYALARAFSCINIIIAKMPSGYMAYAVNETAAPVCAEVELGQMTLTGKKAPCPIKRTLLLEPYSSVCLHRFEPEDGYFMYAYLTADGKTYDTALFPQKWADIHWCEPGLSYAVRMTSAYSAEVSIRAKGYARYVRITSDRDENAFFSDNYFDILPGDTKIVTVRSDTEFSEKDIHICTFLDDTEE